MTRHLIALAATAAAVTFSPSLQAAPLGATAGLGAAADAAAIGETVQYYYGGAQYCWYPGGWRGPGWYRCGFAWRQGFGWGGPMGWRGWNPGGPPPRAYYGPGPGRVGPPPRPVYRQGPPPRGGGPAPRVGGGGGPPPGGGGGFVPQR